MGFIWEKFLRPLSFQFDAERAHELAITALRAGVVTPFAGSAADEPMLSIERFGLRFRNPIGVAAGFDKNGLVVNQLASLGFGFVEVGTVTNDPQPGNPKPRLFRLPKDLALINRLGFNNDGAVAIMERLMKLERKCIVGVNIGKNKDVPNEKATDNYLECFNLVQPVADYVAINVSSPNTLNLRDLQRPDSLDTLLEVLQSRNLELGEKPLLVKIAPDLTEAEIDEIADVCRRRRIAGIIATNTTTDRNDLTTEDYEQFGSGGLSGKPLAARSNSVIAMIFRYTKGEIPIIGVGGVFTPADAFAKIAAGASLIEVYTGFIYRGPSFACYLIDGLAAILQELGFDNLDQAVGSSATGPHV
jgi:dihydroorotate dehydrogenase